MKHLLKSFSVRSLFLIVLISFFMLPSFAADDREQLQYQLIVNLYKQNAFALALEQVAKFKQEFPQSSLNNQIDYLSARLDQEKGNLEVAKQKYEAFLATYGSNKLRADVLYSLGETQYRLNYYLEAIVSFERLKSEYPKSIYVADAIFWSAETSYALKEYEQAQKYYEQYLTKFGDQQFAAQSAYGLTWCAIKNNQYAEAEEKFNKFLLTYPESPLASAAKFYLAVSIFQQKQYSRAVDKFKEIFDLGPQTTFWTQSLIYIAEGYYKTGQYLQAQSFYEEVLHNEPSANPKEQALYGLGWSFHGLQKYQEALDTFTKLLAEFPDTSYKQLILVEQGALYEKLENYKQAETIYQKIIDNSDSGKIPNDLLEQALIGMIKAKYNLSLYKHIFHFARSYFNRFTDKGKFADVVEVYTGESYYRLVIFDQASLAFKRVADRYQQSAFRLDALYKLGLCYSKLDRQKEALVIFNELITKYPKSSYDPQTRFALAELYYAAHDFVQAQSQYQILVEQKDLPEKLTEKSLLGLGWTYFKQAKYVEALDSLDKFANVFPNSEFLEQVNFKRAESLFNIKQFDQAQHAYKLFAEQYPTSSLSLEAKYQEGMSFYKMVKFKEAVEVFEKMGANPKAILQSGWSYYRLADYQNAYLKFAQITESSPTADNTYYKEAVLRQADCLFNMRRYKEALARYKQVRSISGNTFVKESIYGAFLCLLQIDNFTEAKEAVKEYTQLYPQDPIVSEMEERLVKEQHL